jgi:hypothetical protein
MPRTITVPRLTMDWAEEHLGDSIRLDVGVGLRDGAIPPEGEGVQRDYPLGEGRTCLAYQGRQEDAALFARFLIEEVEAETDEPDVPSKDSVAIALRDSRRSDDGSVTYWPKIHVQAAS